MTNAWPVRLALHLNPTFFAPHFVFIILLGAFFLVGLHLQLPGVVLLLFMGLSTIPGMLPHHIVIKDNTVQVRHWLWTWQLKSTEIKEIDWDEQERYLTSGHAHRSKWLSLQAKVRALVIRRHHGPPLLLFGALSNLEQIEKALRPIKASASNNPRD